MDDDEDFEHQLQQEADERHRQDAGSDPGNTVDSGATRVDEDGTVFEFDMEKRAWFPKIDDDFIAKYQMNYGMENTAATTDSTTATDTVTTTTTTTTKATDYAAYYQQYYSNTTTQPADAKAYWDYYNKYCNEYYKSQQAGKNKPVVSEDGPTPDVTAAKEGEQSPTDSKDAGSGGDASNTNEHSHEDGKNPEKGTENEGENLGTADDAQPEYDYAAYYHYYYSHYDNSGDNNTEGGEESNSKGEGGETAKPIAFEPTGNKEYDDYWSTYFSQHYTAPEEDDKEEGMETDKDAEGGDGKKEKKGKRKEPEPGWFDVDMEKLTSVYVSGMPVDITDDEYKELMNKCGLVMYDVRTRKPKLKLYKDQTGANKGDGLCCYIKPESVDLALQIIDGYELRGHRLSVEVAQFELKGAYDPSKKKKKLSNREKKRMKKQQEKLFNWHLEKDVPVRQKRERIIIVKNLFDPNVFEGNPVLINKIRDDLRNECSKHGDVRKVIIYDRHQEGVASVIFKLAEEADACTAAMNNRMWGKRVITAEAWDGNTKYEVEETEAEREKRINEWENFLEEKDGADGKATKDGEAKCDGKKNDLVKSEGVDKGQVKEGGGEESGNECVDRGKDDVCGEDKKDEKDMGSGEIKGIADGKEEMEKGEDEGGEGKSEEGKDAGDNAVSDHEQAVKQDTEAAKQEEEADDRDTEKMETDLQEDTEGDGGV
ncbi:hypothetical protein NP493_321g00001 [Ridgeia piscesae]|uniref:17S U2 SnRNP complex component HTATSF1 n=1 Tax=Ridgeia piscesae TaxID=27915 RepID=A0AAD9L5C2_RIDPI|nr:hypothetical protein NP493_321g00001 [Ridgeia piscesae]